MTSHKSTIEEWADCFAKQDWTRMLGLFTEDITRWEVGAPRRTHGKREFEQEVLPGPEVARSGMKLQRLIEEGTSVVAEGLATIEKRDGSIVRVQFCDLFEFSGEKIKQITAYGAVIPPGDSPEQT